MRRLLTFALAALLSWPAFAFAQEPEAEEEWIILDEEDDKDRLFDELEELERRQEGDTEPTDGETEVWIFEEDEDGSRWVDPEIFGPGYYDAPSDSEDGDEISEIFAPEESVPFYDELEPYGRWAWTSDWGWVWLPPARPEGWRPYSRGHWVETDAGWAFVGDERWASIVYHYGRWTWLSSVGWAWLPGRVWAPAWVEWRVADGYIGWAPLPPRPIVGAAVSAGVIAWSFVAYEHFLAPRVYSYVVPRPRVRTIYHRARHLHRWARHGKRRHLAGPRGSWVHRVAGKRPSRRHARAMRRTAPRPKARRAARREGSRPARQPRRLPRPNASQGRRDKAERPSRSQGRRGDSTRRKPKATAGSFGGRRFTGDLRAPRPKAERARAKTKRTNASQLWGTTTKKKGRSGRGKRGAEGKRRDVRKPAARRGMSVDHRTWSGKATRMHGRSGFSTRPATRPTRSKRATSSPKRTKKAAASTPKPTRASRHTRASRASTSLSARPSRSFKKSAPTTRRARVRDFSTFRGRSGSLGKSSKPRASRPKHKVQRSTPRTSRTGKAGRAGFARGRRR